MSHPSPIPFHGFGLGLRIPHYTDFLEAPQPVDFLEVISENFMVDGGKPLDVLMRVREGYPVALHGVSMNIGSSDGVDSHYLRRLRRLVEHVEPLWVSDHLCWTGIDGHNSHDLLPLPYTGEALDLVADNVHAAQDALGRALVLENPSTYLDFPETAMGEAAFLRELCDRTGCFLLLDVNNIYVSATNHGFDPDDWLERLPLDRVRQVHLAGHSQGRDMLVDTHDAPVPDPVWALYARFIERLGDVAVMIERDDSIPPLPELLAEVAHARDLADAARQPAA
ncbi:MNIO family bufferin maturase [Luteibacter yeojuensis]